MTTHPTTERIDPLAWVADVLGWSPVEAGDLPEGAASFVVLPRAARPKALVPTGRGRIGPGALGAYNDSMPYRARLGRAVTGQMLRFGADRLLRVDRARFNAAAGASPTLLEYLESVLGEPVKVSVALVPIPRPNRKPVLRILSRRGTPLAYAKVGWNDLTRRLVREEASALRILAAADLPNLSIPELLDVGTWQGRSVVLTAPAPSSLIRRCRRNAAPAIATERDVSASMWSTREPLGSSAYLQGLRARAREVLGERGPLVERVAAVIAMVQGVSSDATFGAWHGDWAPWNMSRSSGALFVWDWERFGGPVPFGFDRAHLHFQVANLARRSSVEQSAERARSALEDVPEVRAMGPGAAGSILRLYVIERILRLEEGRSAGEAVRPGLVDAFADHLEAATRGHR